MRYCEEQWASPFRHAENRGYYVPADETKIRRSLHFSPASSGWKLRPETVTEDDLALAVMDGGNKEEEEIQSVSDSVQDGLAATVTNLKV